MNYQQPELQQRLAAEYVLGTLQGPARVRFESLMTEQPQLRRLVQAWEQRLAPLAANVKPQAVPVHLWPQISQRLGFSKMKEKPAKAPFWQWWAWGGSVFASLFAGMLIWKNFIYQPEIIPVYKDLAVLSTDKAEPTWIVRVSADGNRLTLSGLHTVAVPTDKDLELWAIANGAPESLGVIKLAGVNGELSFNAQQRQRFTTGKVLAISLEPRGGSPTGSPTGPVLFTGKIRV